MAQRRRGDGSLYQRGKVWHLCVGIHGQTYRMTTGTTKYTEAVAFKRAFIEQLTRTNGRSGQRLTVGMLLSGVRDSYRAEGKHASADRVEDTIPHWDMHLAGGLARRASTVTGDDLTRYVEQRVQKDGAKLGTIAYELQALRRGYRLKAKDHALPIPAFPSIDPQNARQVFLEEHEVRKILDRLPESTRQIVRFLSLTGWRSSEAKSLTWDQVDWRNGLITLTAADTKTKRPRILPFLEMPELVALLDRARELTRHAETLTKQAVPHVFHRNGRPIRDFIVAFKNAAKAIGRPGVVPHDLRRSVVRQLVWSRVPKELAKQLTGHKSDRVFDRYDIVDKTALRAGMRTLRDFRAKLTEGVAAPDVLHNSLHSAGVSEATHNAEVRDRER